MFAKKTVLIRVRKPSHLNIKREYEYEVVHVSPSLVINVGGGTPARDLNSDAAFLIGEVTCALRRKRLTRGYMGSCFKLYGTKFQYVSNDIGICNF